MINELKHVFMVIIPTDYNTNQNNTSFQYTIGTISANTVNESLVSGNLALSISDHLAQLLIHPELTINNKREKNDNITGTPKPWNNQI